ncbi:hypothetical protein JVU11DRAFT_2974 [Chiua virens]|nr:hypothetical protein JVU11DRAFT_2974 [Chiua virens]
MPVTYNIMIQTVQHKANQTDHLHITVDCVSRSDYGPGQFATLLADIRRASIPLEYADALVATIRLRANYPNQALGARYPLIPPWNMNMTVPSGHELIQYNGFTYVQPSVSYTCSQCYIVTRGKVVGIFIRWINTAPFVLGVSGAVFEKVESVEMGCYLMLDAIDSNTVMYIDQQIS